MSSVFISVIIPAYNAGHYISETLESAASQSFENIEVIIVDDGSTDDTCERVKPFLDDSRFDYIRQENRGVSAARNRGIRESCGEWIAFLDSDDKWETQKLEMQVRLIKECPEASLVFSNGIEFRDSGDVRSFYKREHKFPQGNILPRLLKGNCFWTSSVMVKRADLTEVGLFDEDLTIAEDYDIWIKVLQRGGVAKGVWEPVARYRLRPDGLSRNKMAGYDALLKIYEGAYQRSTDLSHKEILRDSLTRTRSDRTLAEIRHLCAEDPENRKLLSDYLYKAWRQYPRRGRVLRWYFMSRMNNNKVVMEALARKW